nr:zinc finger with UFM1-specific peptidase domain protein [Ipomoea batatas]
MDITTCPFCHLRVLSVDLERHANSHFDDEDVVNDFELGRDVALAPSSPLQVSSATLRNTGAWERPESSSSSSRMDGRASVGRDLGERISCLVNLQMKGSFYHVEGGMINMLRSCLELEPENCVSRLCGYVDHFESIASEDVGWGCGWRNIQMLSSHLLKQRQEARNVLFGGSGFVPDIPSLQRWLEIAWEQGFDMAGSKEFDQEIYGKRNWIGTTECATLFRSFGLRARIVDFCSKTIAPKEVLIDWVWNYFSDPKCTRSDNRHVLVNLAKSLRDNDGWQRLIKRGVHTLRKPLYQLPYVQYVCLNHCILEQCVVLSISKAYFLLYWSWKTFSLLQFSSHGFFSGEIKETKSALFILPNGSSRMIALVAFKLFQGSVMSQACLLLLYLGRKFSDYENAFNSYNGHTRFAKHSLNTIICLFWNLLYIIKNISKFLEIMKIERIENYFLNLLKHKESTLPPLRLEPTLIIHVGVLTGTPGAIRPQGLWQSNVFVNLNPTFL